VDEHPVERPEAAELQNALDRAISQTMHGGGFMANGWVLVASVVDEDGSQGLWTFTSPELMGWQTLGMLGYATQIENAAVSCHEGESDG
jgi:hypothetical protein